MLKEIVTLVVGVMTTFVMLNGFADQIGSSFEELMEELRAIRKELELIRGQLDDQALKGHKRLHSVARTPAGTKAKTTRAKKLSA